MDKWKKYYLDICNAVANNSSCFSRKIGAIIVMDKSIISTGYNGPPRGIPHCDERIIATNDYDGKDPTLVREFISKSKNYISGTCPRRNLGYESGEGLHLCIAGHAERNALINAARNGIAIKGATMYMNCPIPCKDCMIEIINAGISKIVVTEYTLYDEESWFLLHHSDIEVDTFEWE
jgi:dCMP deaminase